MSSNKQITIILADTLRRIGLQVLLTDYFSPLKVCCYSTFEQFAKAGNDSSDYYFISADCLVINAEFFLPRRAKVIVLTDREEESPAPSSINLLATRLCQENLIEQIQQLFANDATPGCINESNKELSSREIDVLQQIVRGITNKEIADKLNISLNTVLSHRKNITAKLGIKTVSGLTFYAIMNGIVSGDEIGL